MNDIDAGSDILRSLAKGLLRLTFNRPSKLNAITSSMYERLADEISQAQHNDSVRAILLGGAGDNFTAGNDIADFAGYTTKVPLKAVEDRPGMRFLFALLDNTKPLVAAIQGHAVGVGLTLTLHCDYVVVAEGSQFQAPFLDLGLVPEAGSSLLLPQLVGRRKATEILLGGEPISAKEAVKLGIANKIVPFKQLAESAENYAIKLASKPPKAMRESLKLMSMDKPALREHMLKEAHIFFDRLQSSETKKIFAEFLSK
jgi:enoyl-CoA hydratase/carnithine racemase